MFSYFQSLFHTPSQTSAPVFSYRYHLLAKYNKKVSTKSSGYKPVMYEVEENIKLPEYVNIHRDVTPKYIDGKFIPEITNDHVLYLLKRNWEDYVCDCHYDDYRPCGFNCIDIIHSNFRFLVIQTWTSEPLVETKNSWQVDIEQN